MDGPSETFPAPASSPFQPGPAVVDPLIADDADLDLDAGYREINARRAQIERPELLRSLRSL